MKHGISTPERGPSASLLEPVVTDPRQGTQIPVVRGQKIGISGDTGVPGSPHLHFEVRQALDQVVDPYLVGLWR